MKKKLVICSGGIDSICMAVIATKELNSHVTLLSFDYGQKATNELKSAKKLSVKYNLKHIILDISSLSFIFGKKQLTDKQIDVQQSYETDVVVPLRNALFLQIGMIYAYSHKYDEILLGSHLDDCKEINDERLFSDCSPEFFKAFELAMDMGTFKNEKKVHIITPSLLGMHKIDLIRKAYQIDNIALFDSWSCYKNDNVQCGICDSCRNRKLAFKQAGIQDLTIYKQ